MADFKAFIKQHTVLFDGAMGTQIQNLALPIGTKPEQLNLDYPDKIRDIHLQYLKAGADVITTNTFGANRLKWSGADYSLQAIIQGALNCCQTAKTAYLKGHWQRPIFIALDLGPIGALLEPSGSLSWEEAYDIYKQQIVIGANAGADLILIETQTDLNEARCALLAAKENSSLPVLVTMSYEPTGRTFTGTDIVTMATVLEGLGATAIGLNCSFGSSEMHPLVKQLLAATAMPVMVQPNAGMPQVVDGKTTYQHDRRRFVDDMRHLVQSGVSLIGGCCGTTPSDIKALHAMIATTSQQRNYPNLPTRIASYAKTITIGDIPKIIGERLNPTGKKKLQEALVNQQWDYPLSEAILQVEQGADILDVNVGMAGIDETATMVELIKRIQNVIDVPLQIDSSSAKTLELAVRYYNGKALINSVNGKEESLNTVLPIAKKYGACILGLTLDEHGLPQDIETRLAIAQKIITRADAYGIPRQNILIDCLTLTASAQQAAVRDTLEALLLVKQRFGVKTVLGVSNVSFGLPMRKVLNATFTTIAMAKGLDLVIMNPAHQQMVATIDAFKVLYNLDRSSVSYIAKYGGLQDVATEPIATMGSISLYDAIVKGLTSQAIDETKRLLIDVAAMEVINQQIIPALDQVGRDFEAGRLFLPQLIKSAQVVQAAFGPVKEKLQVQGEAKLSRGKIALATVEHDVHDIGKNIVKIVLQNYGYDVYDLGKDVAPERLLQVCRDNNIKFIGLSALMTTTVKSMQATIAYLRAHLEDIYIIVGGAVLTETLAINIGADAYAKDPRSSAMYAEQYFINRE